MQRKGWACVALGGALRLWFVLIEHPPFDYVYSDMQAYVSVAKTVALGGGLDRYDVFQPPGTSWLLALPMSVFGTGRSGLWAAAVLWVILSTAAVFFTWRLVEALASERAGLVAAFLVAVNPLLITSAGYYLSETPAMAMITGSLWLGYTAARAGGRRAVVLTVLAGLLGGAAVVVRPALVLNLAVLAVPWLAVPALRRRFAVLAVAAAVVVAAGIAYDSAIAGRPSGLGENAAITFLQGQCDTNLVEGGRPERPFVFRTPPAAQRGGGRNLDFPGHAIWDQDVYFKRGMDCIRDDGLAHVKIEARSLWEMTFPIVPWPQYDEDGPRVVAAVANSVYIGLLALAAIWLIALRRRGVWPRGTGTLFAHLACLVPVALIFFGDSRFRLPYAGFSAGLVAVGCVALAERRPSATA